MNAIYNEIDPYAAQWTRNLIAAGHVAPGVVDERSIVDLRPDDVAGPWQRHFFAGIAVWSYALRLAGVSDDADIWTGSCPCQGLSDAGRKLGFADPRHLWPFWFELIRECRPRVVMGEQVASRLGLEWLDLVCSDLEGAGYAVRAADTCAAGFGAPHIRQRLYFVAYADGERLEGFRLRLRRRGPQQDLPEASRGGEAGALADAASRRRVERLHVGAAEGDGARPADDRRLLELADPGGDERGPRWTGEADAGALEPARRRDARDPWRFADWVPCTDGKARPVEPGVSPLAHGVAGRVGRLRAYGNAINARQALAFIAANLDVITPAEAA